MKYICNSVLVWIVPSDFSDCCIFVVFEYDKNTAVWAWLEHLSWRPSPNCHILSYFDMTKIRQLGIGHHYKSWSICHEVQVLIVVFWYDKIRQWGLCLNDKCSNHSNIMTNNQTTVTCVYVREYISPDLEGIWIHLNLISVLDLDFFGGGSGSRYKRIQDDSNG